MKYRQFSKKLKSLGCQEIPSRGKGSHRMWLNPNTDQSAVIPYPGRKDLKTGTMRSVIRQLGIEWREFQTVDLDT